VLQIAPCGPVAPRNNVGRPIWSVFTAYVNVIHNAKCFFLVYVALCASGSASPVTTAYKPHCQCRVPTRSDWVTLVSGQSLVSTCTTQQSAYQASTVASDGTGRSVWEPRSMLRYLPRCQWVTSSFARPAGLWSVEFECCSLAGCSRALSTAVQWSDWTELSGVESVDWASVTVEIWGMCSRALFFLLQYCSNHWL